MPTDEDFLRELRATFAVEAREHLQTLSQGLLDLEAAPERRPAIVETVFRAAHSLKGAARAVELASVESLCQLLEDVLALMKRNGASTAAAALDTLHRTLDGIASLVEARAPAPDLERLRRELLALATTPGIATPGPAPPTPSPAATMAVEPPPAPGSPTDETVRVPMAKLEAQLLKTEELLAFKASATQRLSELRALAAWFAAWRKRWSAIEHDVHALRLPQVGAGRSSADPRALARMAEFIEWSERAVQALETRLSDIDRAVRQDHGQAARSIDDALAGAKELLLLPVSTLCAPFPRLVRELCRAEGKEADLVLSGEQVELDKHILEALKDPLVHMLRNAVDHGVERPELRQQLGKPRRAMLALAVERAEGHRVRITLADDGAGIDAARVRAAAVRAGLITADEAAQLDDDAARQLVFRSAVSTGEAVTSLSGRGLGLAIVQEHVQRLGGEVQLDSRPGQGTRFVITVPALRATFRGILCEAAGRSFLLPAAGVERVMRVPAQQLRSIEGRPAVEVEGRVLALARLADVLEISAESRAPEGWLQLMLVSSPGQAVALEVDAVLDELEVLVKPLRWPLVRVRNVAAAAVLGSGALVPVLDTADLLESARHVRASQALPTRPQRPHAPSILLAEDSITSRLLLKTLLESAGYRVKTAVDGAEALALLRTEPFDLLVSDVEMPRLNGIDLTLRIRTDRRLAELPVVLLTALGAREDKERGIEAGANAYIVKGGFDQDSLLATVERLLV